MDLPVVNRNKAVFHINRIIVFIVIFYFVFYSLTKSWSLIFYFSLFNVLVSILLLRYYRKNNFTASFEEGQFVVRHRGEVTKISVAEIWDMKNEINNYLSKKNWSLAVVYTIYLRNVYPFGDEIHLSYTFSKENLEKGPVFIQNLKSKLDNAN